MRTLKDTLNESIRVDELNKVSRNNRGKAYKYHPNTRKELVAAIEAEIKLQGNKADLNCIDTSNVDDMSWLFWKLEFNGDISQWDTSRVTDMSGLFYSSKFDGDISQWDVSNVIYMSNMFINSPLEGKEPKWYWHKK